MSEMKKGYVTDAFFKENVNRYELLAMKTVISYFKKERIRVNLSDFRYNDEIHNNITRKNDSTSLKSYRDIMNNTGHTVLGIKYKSVRFKKYIDNKQNDFLKYINCRVTKDEIIFTFEWNELDLIGVEKVEFDESREQKEKIEKIKVLIEKLFALGHNNPSENEALSANTKAQKLLKKYHLTLEEVYGADMKIGEDIEQAICDCGRGNSRCNWRYELAMAVADGYCCKHYCVGKMADGYIVFYGYKDDVLLARRMFVFLFDACHRLGLEYQRKNPNAFNSYVSFCKGFVNGARTEMQKQCTALALVIQPKVEEEWKEFSAMFGSRTMRQSSVDGSAYEDGIIEGKRSMKGKYIEG